MMQHRKHRLLVLAIVFAVYNLLTFVIPFQRGAVFWVAYAFAVITILAQIAVDRIAFRNADSLKRAFMGIPLIRISYRCLCAQLAVCAVLMIVSTFVLFPAWLAIVPCALILAFGAVAVIKADWARKIIEQVDTRHLSNTKFMHAFRADLQALMPRVQNSVLMAKLEKLSDAARYSDSVSAAALVGLEADMERQLALLRQAVLEGSACEGIADELLLMLNERNQKSRAAKRQQYQA